MHGRMQRIARRQRAQEKGQADADRSSSWAGQSRKERHAAKCL